MTLLLMGDEARLLNMPHNVPLLMLPGEHVDRLYFSYSPVPVWISVVKRRMNFLFSTVVIFKWRRHILKLLEWPIVLGQCVDYFCYCFLVAYHWKDEVVATDTGQREPISILYPIRTMTANGRPSRTQNWTAFHT